MKKRRLHAWNLRRRLQVSAGTDATVIFQRSRMRSQMKNRTRWLLVLAATNTFWIAESLQHLQSIAGKQEESCSCPLEAAGDAALVNIEGLLENESDQENFEQSLDLEFAEIDRDFDAAGLESKQGCCIDLLRDAAASEALRAGLIDAGFDVVAESIFVVAAKGITVEVSNEDLYVAVDCKRQSDVCLFVNSALSSISEEPLSATAFRFGKQLVDWAVSQDATAVALVPATTAHQASTSINNSERLDLSLLPSCSALGADGSRHIKIITYGRVAVQTPPLVERHYCVDHKGIRYRLSGREAAKVSGLDELIQARVCRCALFQDWLKDIVREIEGCNLASIGVFCWKGRHRSVAAAEMLRMCYYPLAEVTHLCL
eukprot:TRINITY_DN24964_c0_g1_i1.p1 TRINITY_DN24964_c0_g1~~TRINITY_DN24964_c0_g1_i1.p1  ORF type:complete len:373 (+),score=47.05 TRINITY_DN24964_c0_g1_i1:140-1258(+)